MWLLMHKTTLKYNNCFLLKVKWARFFESANECHSVALIAIILLAHVSWKQVLKTFSMQIWL